MAMMRWGVGCAVALCLSVAAWPVAAQQAGTGKRVQKDPGTPLSTIMNTHLRADVPEAKDFVRESRPPADTLQYQPITPQVTDVVRPKTRTPSELTALESQLDKALARNRQAGGAVTRRAKSGN
jgi:hypothetical protein